MKDNTGYKKEWKGDSQKLRNGNSTDRQIANEELFAETQELERFFSINLDLLCIANVEGNFIRVNKSWESILGYTKEHLENKKFLDFVHPDDLESTLKVMADLERQEQVLNFVNRFRCLDGSYKYIEWRSQPYDQLIYAAARDVTERILLENRLQERERYLSTILETIQEGFLVIDAQDAITDVNTTYCSMSGYTRAELLGMKISDLDAKDTPLTIQQRHEQIPVAGPAYFTSRHRRKDGSLFDAEISTACMQNDPRVLVSFCRDISERIHAEKALKNSHDLMRYIIEHNRSAVMILDQDLEYQYVSQSYLNIYGLKAEDVIGKHHYEVFPDLPQKWRDAHQLALAGIVSSAEEDLFAREDGSLHWARWECRPWYQEEGTIGGIVIYTESIDERKRIEQIIYNEKEQFKTTLLSVGDGVVSTDNSGNILVMNPIAEQLTGWSQGEAYGKPFARIFTLINEFTREACENPVQKVLQTNTRVELANHTLLISKQGMEIPIEDSAAPIIDSAGEVSGVVVVFRDCRDRYEKQKQIELLSFHDPLTGLHNRRYMEDAVSRLDTARNLPFAVMVLDVNGLKLTNDAFGHEMGDRLLKTVADLLAGTCRKDDIIGRMGGDEFLILLPRTDAEQAFMIKQRILEAAQRVMLDSVIVSLAAGFAVKTEADQPLNAILTEADNHMYKDKLKYGKTMRSQTIEMVLRNINLKYDQEQIHTERVSQYCEAIARAMNFDEKEVQDIKTAGVLHDIGKIMVPPELLNTPGKLTAEEFAVIQKHTETGYQILKSVDEYAMLAEVVLYHHERWDGTGYPEGLAGHDIPLHARIIAVADSFEAMTANRPYHTPKSKKEAQAELVRCAGTQFDPAIVSVFVEKVLS